MPSVTIEADRVRIGERFALSFHRTLRLPDDGRDYPLPPSLGLFPLRRVEDLGARAPALWAGRGGVFLPMYRREALWIGFESPWPPVAVKVGVGRINAVTGAPWDETLRDDPQDYLVCPPQPWLDGIKSGEGRVRQFVAMPLGAGYSVESQISGEERFGGLQIVVFESRTGWFPDRPPELPLAMAMAAAMAPPGPMGIAAGGAMRQKVYPDTYGLEAWDPDNRGVLDVHILDAEHYRDLTGDEPPPPTIDALTYTRAGLPWFDLYDEASPDLRAQDGLAGVRSIRALDEERKTAGRDPEPIDVPESQVKKLGYPKL